MGIFDKAKDAIKGNEHQLDSVVDRVGDMLDERTGGQHAQHIDKGQDFLKQQFGGGQAADPAEPAPGQNPDMAAEQGVEQQPGVEQGFDQQPAADQGFDQQPAAEQAFDQQPAAEPAFDQQPAAEQAFDQQPAAEPAFEGNGVDGALAEGGLEGRLGDELGVEGENTPGQEGMGLGSVGTEGAQELGGEFQQREGDGFR